MSTPLRVLLVEDSEDDALLVLHELERRGYAPTCTRVDTSEGMRAALAAQPWDIVIADYAMPDFSGTAALDLLKESGLDLPFIIVSGTIGEEVAVATMKAGAHDYIMKDHLARLAPAVARELREAGVRREQRRAVEALRESARKTAVLLEVAKDISGTLDLHALLERVQRRTAELLPCDRVATFYLDQSRGTLRMIGHHGIPPALQREAEALEFPAGQQLGGLVAAGQSVVINDIHAQPWLPVELCTRFGVAALVAAPLLVRGRRIGVLVGFTTGAGRRFEAGQVELCEGIARQLGVAIEAAELYRTQQEEAQVSGALAQVGAALISALDTPALLDRLCQVTTEVLECDLSHTLIRRADEDVYVPIGGYGATPEEREAARVVKVPGALMSVLLSRLEHDDVAEVHTVPSDVVDGPHQEQVGRALHLCMALRRGAEIIGVHTAYRRGNVQSFGPQQRRIARGIAQLASLVLEHARLVEELERVSHLKSDFLATMSHELRTPLNVIIGYNDLLIEGAYGELGAEEAEPLRRMGKSARQLLDLINATLDLGRLEAGQLPVEPREFGLADLLAELDADTQELQAKPGLRFQWAVGPDLPRLHTDPMKLKVVLKNLIANAAKFTERGMVTVAARNQDDGVEISVADTGIGISPEAQAYIFEPFRQVDGSTTRRYGGVGLGLYIVRRLLELLGGRVWVESDTGHGSTFKVWLPMNGVKRVA
jgi:signal transduction histidine kinase/CheY-like chemotaxis protein